jgi:ribosomal protein S27AE
MTLTVEERRARGREYQRRWRAKHPEEAKQKNVEYYKLLREQAFDILERRCSRCGFDDIRALQLDHVLGGGTRERRHGMKRALLQVIKTGGEGYQVLCANCNSIKRIENGECSSVLWDVS